MSFLIAELVKISKEVKLSVRNVNNIAPYIVPYIVDNN